MTNRHWKSRSDRACARQRRRSQWPALALALIASAPAPAWARLVARRIVIEGPHKTRAGALADRMRLHPGDTIDMAVLAQARINLLASDLYSAADVWVDLNQERLLELMYRASETREVDVHVTVHEKQSWVVVPSASVGAGNRAIGAAYSDRDLAGEDLQLTAAAQLADVTSYALMVFRDPIIGHWPFSFDMTVLYRRDVVHFFEETRAVMAVPMYDTYVTSHLGYLLTPTFEADVGFTWHNMRLSPPEMLVPGVTPPPYNRREGQFAALQLWLTYDDTRAPEGLTRGTRFSLKNEMADHALGADFDYAKIDLDLELHGFVKGSYPSLVFWATAVEPTSGRGVPLAKLLRLGGSDLRGYPVDALHGDMLLSLKLQEQVPVLRAIQVPLLKTHVNLAAAAFMDSALILQRHPNGVVSAEPPARPTPHNLYIGAGLGLRVVLPGVDVPAVRLDVGYGFAFHQVAFTISLASVGS